jgi:sulfopyruvate decarboxylase TPP-binding subunit
MMLDSLTADPGQRSVMTFPITEKRCVFSGEQIRGILDENEITHIVWLPDSTLGQWESQLRGHVDRPLITVCREGEAWAIAAGLQLGGARPIVMIQCTGLFESGDAMRNAIHDYRLPLAALIGYRSYLSDATLPGDTARKFAEPILRAWDLDYLLVTDPDQLTQMSNHYQSCRIHRQPGIVLLAEGKA